MIKIIIAVAAICEIEVSVENVTVTAHLRLVILLMIVNAIVIIIDAMIETTLHPVAAVVVAREKEGVRTVRKGLIGSIETVRHTLKERTDL